MSMTSNQIAYWNLREQHRANVAKEAENTRANKARESIQAATNQINLDLGKGNLAESVRSNRVKEGENERSHKAQEALSSWVNYLSEQRIPIEKYNAESNRFNASANLSNAATRQAELVETNRTNLEQERLKQEAQEEIQRHNREGENLQRFRDVTSASAGLGSNDLRALQLGETIRHDMVGESIDRARQKTNALKSAADAANQGLNTLSNVQSQQIKNAFGFFQTGKRLK